MLTVISDGRKISKTVLFLTYSEIDHKDLSEPVWKNP